MKAPELIDQALLDRISAQAKASHRKRKNYNLHVAENDLSHRLLNAIEPSTYIPPHRHLDPNKDESMVMVRGKMGVVFFDAEGNVTLKTMLCAGGPISAINIPCGTFHSLLAFESDTVFFEAKGGPYAPLTDEEYARWAPRENDVGVASYLAKMEKLFD